MDVLRRADRRALWWGLAAWLAICVIGSLWALPRVESSLSDQATGVASLRAVDGASIEFNGRDGYLSVPAGTPNAEQIAADIAAIRGVRDVEIEVLGAAESDTATADGAADADETEGADESEDAVEADRTQASFAIDWSDGTATQTGNAPEELGDAIRDLGVGSPETSGDLAESPGVESTLGALAPLVGSDLLEGSVSVDGDTVRVTGTAADADALARANEALAQTDAEVDLQIDPDAAGEESADADADADAGADDDSDAIDSAQVAIDRLLALDAIEFESGTATPTAATEAVIDEIAATLTDFPEVDIVINGHTDARGDDAANQALSEARAQAVADGLVERGIDADRLTAIGKGEAEPIDSNDTPEGQQRNRRVDIDVEESA